ncbi:hypothetical protein IC229_27460 [Spirosoma sp. BT702]|uniref:Uncharacterized protein n=1 Tax=Spirosoma profusum TaxID=2771354 RepID=A0A926Y0M6_9BACT|nr:hypothetical protein [Spirosoma profusum]MBD2704409.1 hypothetical protein [Spirosoma profusum]
MASPIQTPIGITYNGKLTKEYILIPALQTSGLDDFIKVLTAVKTKQQVSYVEPFTKITIKDPGCDSTPNNKQLTFREKFWDPQPVEAYMSICYTDLYNTQFEETLNGGTQKPDLTGTPAEELVLEALIEAADNDLKRMFWLSNKAIIASNLTGGSAEVKNYNQVDGIWKRIKDAVTANLTPRYTISQNAATTTAGQVLPDGEAKKILRQVYRKQKRKLKAMKATDKRFLVTRSIYDNYSEELSGNDKLESSRAQLIDGTPTLKFEGILLEVLDVVDQALEEDFTFTNSGETTTTELHRVVLTVKDNLQLSVDTDERNPVAFDSWYERKDKKQYARADYELDTQIAREDLVSVAY